MSDTKWISYFRRAVLLTMALPECGGATAPVASSEGDSATPWTSGNYPDTGVIPPINDEEAAAPVPGVTSEAAAPLPGRPFMDAALAVGEGSAEDASVPEPQDAGVGASCNWSGTTGQPGCYSSWSRMFTGDAMTCAGFVGSGTGDSQCGGPCGAPPPTVTVFTCQVTSATGGGTVSCYAACVGNGGRRPLYFASLGFGVAPSGRELGTHFARAACMEAGSVEAFRWLREELVAHGAPKRLVRGASRAVRDEIRHVRQTSALARRLGEQPIAPPAPPPRIVRSLPEMAIANAVEGCVRETYSTLECLWQGRCARDPVVRATMKRIARDELRHLALSWAVHDWAMRRLSKAARARVREALCDEIATLKGELRADPDESLVRAGGLPRAFQSQALVDAIAAKIAA